MFENSQCESFKNLTLFDGDFSYTTSDITKKIDELKNLEHFGKDVADTIEMVLPQHPNEASDGEVFFSATSHLARLGICSSKIGN